MIFLAAASREAENNRVAVHIHIKDLMHNVNHVSGEGRLDRTTDVPSCHCCALENVRRLPVLRVYVAMTFCCQR